MSEPRYFERKPLKVAAVQWTGSNAEEMADVFGAHFAHDAYCDPDDGAGVLTSKHTSWEPLYRTNWALLSPGGTVAVMTAEEFAETFQAVA